MRRSRVGAPGYSVSFEVERDTLISKPQANRERPSSDEATPRARRNFGHFRGKISAGAFRYNDSIVDRPLAILALLSHPRQPQKKTQEAHNMHNTMRNLVRRSQLDGRFVMKRVGCCLGLLLCALPRHALAQDQPPRAVPAQPPAFEPQPRVWYGSEILISDAVTLSVTTIGLTLLATSEPGAPDSGIAMSPLVRDWRWDRADRRRQLRASAACHSQHP